MKNEKCDIMTVVRWVALAIVAVVIAAIAIGAAKQQGMHGYQVNGAEVKIYHAIGNTRSCQKTVEKFRGEQNYGIDTINGNMWIIAQRNKDEMGEHTLDIGVVEQDDGTQAIVLHHLSSGTIYVINGTSKERECLNSEQIVLLTYALEHLEHWETEWDPFTNLCGDAITWRDDNHAYIYACSDAKAGGATVLRLKRNMSTH